jgi:hypothetical protein
MKKNEALIKIQVYRILKLNKIIRLYRSGNKKYCSARADYGKHLHWRSVMTGGILTLTSDLHEVCW